MAASSPGAPPPEDIRGGGGRETGVHRRTFLAAAAALTVLAGRDVAVAAAVPEVASSPPTGAAGDGADPRFFIAGGTSAAVSHGIATPVDVVKTKMQAEPEKYRGIRMATRSIIEDEGPATLVGGLGPTVVGYGIEGALKFGCYESLKPVFLDAFGPAADSAQPFLAAAACAGALASVVLCPMEETRIRLVTDPSFGKGLMDGLPRLLREEGIVSPFSGLGAMLSKQVPYTVAKQVSFDMFASALYGALLGYSWLSQAELSLVVEFGAAVLASVVACVASQPGDALLTETYRKGGGRGLAATVSTVYLDGGLQAFFRGISARFVHVGLIITFQLILYDQIKQSLGLPASGTVGS